MIPPKGERGTALLTVLLLVAVMATIAGTAMDRVGLATRLAQNAGAAAQARAWLGMAETLAAVRIEDLLAADSSQTTLKGGWMGAERSIALPDGSTVRARLDDGANCFNLNSLVQTQANGTFATRASGRSQFVALMSVLGIAGGEAEQIAAGATDYIDSDSNGVAEAGAPNALMIDSSELLAVPGIGERHYSLLERWVCALPTADLSPINVNTLAPEQAPLIAMLDPVKIDVSRARAALAGRPADGFGSVLNFWKSAPLAGVEPPSDAASQLRVRSSFFRLSATVNNGRIETGETMLLDARTQPVRVVNRGGGSA